MPDPRPRTWFRPHALIRWLALVGFVVIVVIARVPGVADVSTPRRLGFRIALWLAITCNVVWWTLADETLVRAIRKKWPQAILRLLLAAGMAVMLWPMVDMSRQGRFFSFLGTPTWAVSGLQLWHMLMAMAFPVVTAAYFAVRVTIGVFRRLQRLLLIHLFEPPLSKPSAPAITDPRGLSRRQWLANAAVFAPVLVTGGLTAFRGKQNGHFFVRRYNLPAPWLPSRLRGLTITSVSDTHVGRLYRPEFLPRLVDAANRLDGDLLLFGGDLIDMSNNLLPPGIDAVRNLRHRHGKFLCVGNHDLIDDGYEYVNAVRRNGLDLLIDQRRTLDIGGEKLTIAGLNWARNDIAHENCAGAALRGYDPRRDGPCIALAHHPHAFDALARRGVALTLSGHTHGGQLMLLPPRSDGFGDAVRDVGAGGMMFRYVRGFYERNNSTLFVNSGVGNWFPVRWNAPAEIVQIRLV